MPMPAVEPGRGRFDDQGAQVTRSWLQALQGPIGKVLGVAVSQKSGRPVGGQGDIKLLQGERQALAPGLDVGFFAGPTVKKAGSLLLNRQTKPFRLFMGREKTFDNLLDVTDLSK